MPEAPALRKTRNQLSFIPRIPPPGSSPDEARHPISEIWAGFGNPLNVYFWSLEAHKGRLYLGTFDYSYQLQNLDLPLLEPFIASDLWSSKNGEDWRPVTLNGFGNPDNYGVRTLLSADGDLFIGTANPFMGLEVWKID
jgi:hypothetical protein